MASQAATSALPGAGPLSVLTWQTACAFAAGVVVASLWQRLRKPAAAATATAPGELAVGDPNDDYKMVLVVRTDLGMGKGKAAAQCCHACLAAYVESTQRNPQAVEAWEEGGQAKVTLKGESEEELVALQREARKQGLVACVIRDAGRTQIAAGSRTVLAIGPAPKSLIDNVTGHLKLY